MMKKLVFLLALMQLAFLVESNCQLTNGLVSYWKLDGSVTDTAGTNNGTLIGTPTSTSGKIGSAYSFVPSPSFYISIPNSTSLDIHGNSISLSAWAKPISGGTQMIVSKISGVGTHNSPYFQYNLQLYQGSTLYPRFLLSIGGTVRFAASSSVSLDYNQWHHITGTYDGTNMRLYVNGALVATTAVTGNITSYSTPVYISKNGVLGETFIGAIDEVGIWNRALTATEVNSLYNSSSGLTYPFSASYSLSTTASPTAGGSISLSPTGGNYSSGTTVTATAVANSGYTFSGWSGALTGSTNPGTITMNANKTLTANFTQTPTYSLTITSPTNGTITASPVGPNYASGTTVTLTANPNSGYQLNSWGGALSGNNNPTTLVMNGNKTVSATFTQTASGSGVWQSNGNNIFYNSGNVGIGTSAPDAKLKIEGNHVTTKGLLSLSSTSGHIAAITFYHGGTYSGAIFANTDNDMHLGTDGKDNIKFYTQTASNIRMTIASDGNVGIGTSSPTQKLTVNGKILATEVEVVSSIASDYVFEPEYQLMPLTDLEIYLKQHKHLPGIPSALEFKDKGQNLGEMQDLLLRKIEELTLYMLELKKENEEMKTRLEILESTK